MSIYPTALQNETLIHRAEDEALDSVLSICMREFCPRINANKEIINRSIFIRENSRYSRANSLCDSRQINGMLLKI